MKRYFLSMFLPLLLLSCRQEELPLHSDAGMTSMLPYVVTVEQGTATRASFSGSSIDSGHYVFQEGDMLYVTGGGGHISGVLSLVSGAGEEIASFGGTLSLSDGFVPDEETEISATLVGADQQDGFFTISDGKITGGPFYPTSIPYASEFREYVRKYGHFTSTNLYSVRKFTLSQQTVFLNFSIDFYRSALTSPGATVSASLKDAAGTVLRTVTGIPLGGNAAIGKAKFTTVFPAGEGLAAAQIWVEDESVRCLPDFDSGLYLEPDRYYSVTRNAVDDFTIEARERGATVTFNYASTPADQIQYRREGGNWTDYLTASGSISLSSGEKVSFRGKRGVYNNSTGSLPLVSVDNPVYIYGDLMSLVCEGDYARKTSVEANAFKAAFKNGSNLYNRSDKPLVLSATTIGESCFQEMFSGCTNLSQAPDLLAEEVPAGAYKLMFYKCKNITNPPDMSAMTTVRSQGYNPGRDSDGHAAAVNSGCNQMFKECTGLTALPNLSNVITVEPFGFYEMFWGCTGLTGALPSGLLSGIGTITQGCFFGMFEGCSNITAVPDGFLPQTALAKECYRQLFKNCSKLSTVPQGLLPATELADLCYTGMFERCGVLAAAPDLPAPLLVNKCYEWMFENCKGLRSIKCLATNSTSVNATSAWLQNTTNTSDCHFYKKTGATWSTGNNGIPSAWTVEQVEN